MEKPKAKIEQGKLRLPKSLLNPNEEFVYMAIFEKDPLRVQHLEEAIDAGAKLDRKVYRIRDKELVKFVGQGLRRIGEIHDVTKATIGLFADADSNRHRHSYIDLIGIVEEVRAAEDLIIDDVLKFYSPLEYPIILMPTTIYDEHLMIPVDKVAHVCGPNNTNILRMEIESGAWIKIEAGPVGPQGHRVVKVFGPEENVKKAIRTIPTMTNDNEGQEEAIEAVKGEGEGMFGEMLSLIRMYTGLWW